MPPLRNLKGSRRDLAIAIGESEKTAREVARSLGRPTGSIFGVLRRMHEDGLLKADTDPDPPTRGTSYRLTKVGAELLAKALSHESGIGQLVQGQRLLAVRRGDDFLAPSKVLRQSESVGMIAWAAEMPNGWLLVMAGEVDSFRAMTLRVAFEKAGCRCYEDRIDAVIGGTLQRERAETLASE